jgi:5-methylcytosine-specific restriction endonuclease McrA
MAMKSGVRGSLRRLIFRRDGYRCQECGLVGEEKKCPSGSFTYPTVMPATFLSIDHIKPKSKGGESTEENLRTLCTRCNTLKGVTYA